jgi:hypothetical protein
MINYSDSLLVSSYFSLKQNVVFEISFAKNYNISNDLLHIYFCKSNKCYQSSKSIAL